MTISNNVKSVRVRENSAGRLSVMRIRRIALRVKRCMRRDFLTLLLLIAFRTGYYTSAQICEGCVGVDEKPFRKVSSFLNEAHLLSENDGLVTIDL